MTWLLDIGDGETALRAAFGFSGFSMLAERWSEGLRWFERALTAAPEPSTPVDHARRLVRLGSLIWSSPNQARAPSLYEEALELLEDPANDASDPELQRLLARTVQFLGVMHLYLGEGGDNNEHFTREMERALELAQGADDQMMVAVCLGNLAHHADPRGDPNESRRKFAEAERIFEEIGNTGGLSVLGWQRANFEFHAGNMDSAKDAWETAIDTAQDLGLETTVRRYRVGLALTELESGDHSAAVRIREGIKDLFDDPDIRTGGTRALLQNLIVARAGADAAESSWGRVALAAGASETVEQERNPVRWDLLPYFERTVATAREQLGLEEFEAARTRGSAMPRNEIIDFLGND